MNYRHAFHAGNFADVVKHAALIETLARLGRPLTVIDTHAGAGRYDLAGPEAVRSGEAAAGVGRLMAAGALPPPLAALAAAVREINVGPTLRWYPGSPWLVARAMRRGDRAYAFDLRPEEHAALARLLKDRPAVETRCTDGFEALTRLSPQGTALALVDPPFERADDYDRTARTVGGWIARNRAASAMVWLPLKDLETLDGFLRDLEDACRGAPLLVAETRLRPLSDPMRMNGCALVFVRPPAGLGAPLQAVCGWVADKLGEAGASARIWAPAP